MKEFFLWTSHGTTSVLFRVLGWYFNFSIIPTLFDSSIDWDCVFKVGFSFPYIILTFLVVEIVDLLLVLFWGFSVELCELEISVGVAFWSDSSCQFVLWLL